MGYNRIATPRAYVDLINYNLAHRWSAASNITVLQDDGSTAVTFDAGTKESMFDLRPANYAQIAHDTQAFYIQYDTEFATDAIAESNFIAILGHNFKDADAVFKVEIDDDSAMGSATAVTTTGNHTKVINAAADSTADYIDPASNGWTLITWNTQTSDNRYVRITIEDDDGTSSNFAEDVQIGAILYGEYIDFPHSPDMSIQTTIDYDGTKLQNSVGGNTYANTPSFGQPKWAATTPWIISQTSGHENYSFGRRYGRINHQMNFSYITDTDIFAPNQHSQTASNWFDSSDLHSQFYNKILGQHNPFLFTIDKDSTTEGDYGLFRLADSGLNVTQVAHRTWSMGLNLIETW